MQGIAPQAHSHSVLIVSQRAHEFTFLKSAGSQAYKYRKQTDGCQMGVVGEVGKMDEEDRPQLK